MISEDSASPFFAFSYSLAAVVLAHYPSRLNRCNVGRPRKPGAASWVCFLDVPTSPTILRGVVFSGANLMALLTDLPYWNNMIAALSTADQNGTVLNKENFTDNYAAIVLAYERVKDDHVEKTYLIAQYRKVESWYKRSVKFGFVANTIKQKDEEIFVLNGCIDTAIVAEDVFVLQETAFEKVFSYYEKSKRTVAAKKAEIENWKFLDNPKSFYEDVVGKKGATTKLARALEKAVGDFSDLEPATVKHTLSQYDEFKDLVYDEDDCIKFTPSVRDLIIDILRLTYARDLFSDSLVHTKGV